MPLILPYYSLLFHVTLFDKNQNQNNININNNNDDNSFHQTLILLFSFVVLER